MIYCFITKTKGEFLFYYFKNNPNYYNGFSIKKGVIRKRLTIKVLERIYDGYSQDLHFRFKMNRLELNNPFFNSLFFKKSGFKLLYKI